jgi:hypothetical protein
MCRIASLFLLQRLKHVRRRVRFRPGRPKTVTTPEIIDQIHELILEDRRISAKSIAEQLGISCERVGSFIKIWTCGSSSQRGF